VRAEVTAPNALEAAALRKSYGPVQAVRDVSFNVRQGEIVALLGPNGAGKTTTLEILEGFRRRDGGVAEVLGLDPGDRSTGRELRERTGLVLQEIAVEPYLTVRETITREAGYYPAPRDAAEVISMVGLGGLERRKVRALSGGQKRRLDLALGLTGNPELLFLDEPTTGFDPGAKRNAWDVIKGLAGLGKTIFLTSHSMDEVQFLADRVVIIAAGKIVAEGTPESLMGRQQADTMIRFRYAGTLPEAVGAGAHVDGDAVELVTRDPTRTLYELTSWAVHNGVMLEGLQVTRPSLEDVYLEITKEAEAAGATV
jgi:ABC-2 type transport system ATP-binding protein